MADDATLALQATMLPDDIQLTIAGAMSVAPADATQKWYYKHTAISHSASADLIAGHYLTTAATTSTTAPETVASGDLVKFLLVKNDSTEDGIMLSIDGGAAAHDLADGIFIGASETWFGRLPNVTVANLHCIASDDGGAGDATVNAQVFALLDDVSA